MTDQAPARGRRVLILDDDAALLRLIRTALVSEGFEVVVAQDGVRGLEEVDGNGIDVVVLDLQMPRMDGRAMYQELRSGGHSLPVLILSAYGAERARRELDAEAAMSKPFDVDELVDRIRALLPAAPADREG